MINFGFTRRELTVENTSLMAMTSEQIMGVVQYAHQKNLKLRWYFKRGDTRVGRIIKVTGMSVLIEEKTMWALKARFFDVADLFSVSFL
jgi:hypothetical protein